MRTIIIAEHKVLAENLANIGLGLKPEEWVFAGPNDERVFEGIDPGATTVYYFWHRPTPLYTPCGFVLEMVKARGFCPICVTDY